MTQNAPTAEHKEDFVRGTTIFEFRDIWRFDPVEGCVID